MPTQEEMKCKHHWLFLRQNKEKSQGGCPKDRYFDIFYCSRCLSYKAVEVGNAN